MSESDNESLYDDEDIEFETIDNFNREMLIYKDFYKENIETIKMKFLYVNQINMIEKIRYDDLILKTPNIIKSCELIKILKTNNNIMDKYYKINSICLYNVSIDPENIQYISDENFLRNIDHLNDIKIEPTINIFNDLNELLFIFKEKNVKNNIIKTKKISIKLDNYRKKTRKTNY